jgi:hypothetical protein
MRFAAAVVIVASFQAIEQSNANVTVIPIPFASQPDPPVSARALLRMIA